MKLEGKVALITGAATGIGRATALLFAKEGAQVVIADINEKDADETVQRIKKDGGDALFTYANLVNTIEIEKMVRTTVATYGKLHIFYHNAGVAGPGRIELTTEEAYDQIMDIHVKAGFFGAKFAAPEIKKAGGGSILFTASGLGLRPSSQSPAYSVSKAGLHYAYEGFSRFSGKRRHPCECDLSGSDIFHTLVAGRTRTQPGDRP